MPDFYILENWIDTNWVAEFLQKGHIPQVQGTSEYSKKRIDFVAYNVGNHNGPICIICNWGNCMYCVKPENIPNCLSQKRTKEIIRRLIQTNEELFRRLS